MKLNPVPVRSLLAVPHWAVVEAVLPLGPESSAVSGGVVSIVKRSITGVGSVEPPALARTANVWSPLARGSNATGLEQPVNAAPSSEHSNGAPGGVEMNEKLGVCRGPERTDPLNRALVAMASEFERWMTVSG